MRTADEWLTNGVPPVSKIWSQVDRLTGIEYPQASLCGGMNDLPIPYDTWPNAPGQYERKREDFAAFHQNSQWRVYPWEPHLWMRDSGGTWRTPGVHLAEPAFTGGTTWHDENWTALQQDMHDIQLRDQWIRTDFPNIDLFFNKNWDTSVQTPPGPQIDTSDPHNWHPATNASVVVGPRDGNGNIPVLVAWNQVPPALRKSFQLPAGRTAPPTPAYEVRGVRLSINTGTGVVSWPSGYSRFGSDTELNGAPGPRVARSVRGPAAAVFRPVAANDFGSSRAFFQMEGKVYEGIEGSNTATPFEATLAANTLRFRPPKAATHPERVTSTGQSPSTVEVVAWLRPDPAGTGQEVAYRWSLPSTATQLTETRAVTGFSTTDPRAEIVAVVPFVRMTPLPAEWPVARIVWKADDDVYWCDVPCQPSTASPTAQRGSPATSGKGPFPTHETEVSVSKNLILWTYDGAVLAIRP